MESVLEINNQYYQLQRYPETVDKSLKAWSNAELMVLDYFFKNKKSKKVHLFNDRFGVWNCALQKHEVTTVYTYASQQKAIELNLKLNKVETKVVYKNPLESLQQVELALIKIPKSLELFELFLKQIHQSSTNETEVVCGFMTKYFSTSFLTIAERYFDVIEQSKAWKKARLLLLKQPKSNISDVELIKNIDFKGTVFKQYYGVFSSGHIDIGTQFFLEHLTIYNHERKILDLACGNGVIGHKVLQLNPNTEITLLDDFNLAIESSKLNIDNKKATFICDNTLTSLKEKSFDVVVSNPPFHFEHENNIEVSLVLFKEVLACLKHEGRFVLVANKHLNYKTHLSVLFNEVTIIKENTKFIIYECKKG